MTFDDCCSDAVAAAAAAASTTPTQLGPPLRCALFGCEMALRNGNRRRPIRCGAWTAARATPSVPAIVAAAHPSIHPFVLGVCLPAGRSMPRRVVPRSCLCRGVASVVWWLAAPCAALSDPGDGTIPGGPCNCHAMRALGTMSCRYGQRAVVTRRRDSGLASVTCLGLEGRGGGASAARSRVLPILLPPRSAEQNLERRSTPASN